MESSEHAAPLSGSERAAILLLGLEEEVAYRILQELSEAEIQRLHDATRMLRQPDFQTLVSVFRDFVTATKSGGGLVGGEERLRRLAGRALGQHRAQKLLKIRGDSTDALERLQRFDARTLAAVLERENPQAVAAILAHIDPSIAADILVQLGPEFQFGVFRRLTRLGEVPEATLREVTDSLVSELAALGDAHSTSVDGPGRAAAILQNTTSEASNAILAQLEAEDPLMASEIRRSMFTFEDLVHLDSRSMQVLIREISTEQLIISLKSASDEVRDKFFSNVSSRAAEMMREDLEVLGPKKVSEVERAQLEIVETAQRLEAEGKIVIMGSGEAFI
jgi:flagellar motor switch protein FliG